MCTLYGIFKIHFIFMNVNRKTLKFSGRPVEYLSAVMVQSAICMASLVILGF